MQAGEPETNKIRCVCVSELQKTTIGRGHRYRVTRSKRRPEQKGARSSGRPGLSIRQFSD